MQLSAVSSLNNLRTRLSYQGGCSEGRMKADKLKSLKRAMFASYQAATAVLADGREFKCLMNPNKLKVDYDEKIISIPFEDICLNAPRAGKTHEGIQTIGMKSGDVFEWKETGTFWIVYLQRLEEKAYFRAQCRRCQHEIEINGKKYHAYVRGPQETTIDWQQKKGIVWNNLNYTLALTIALTEDTEAFFHRFAKIKFKGKTWEVQAIDNISTENVIDVYLKEYFSNEVEDAYFQEQKDNVPEIIPPSEDSIYIEGDSVVYPFDVKEYTIKNAFGGEWILNGTKARIVSQNEGKVTIEIISGRSGVVSLLYKRKDEEDIVLDITIESL